MVMPMRPLRFLKILSCALAVATFGATVTGAQEPSVADLVERHDYEGLRARGPEVMEELAALYRQQTKPASRRRIAGAFYQLGWKSEAAAEALLPDVEGEGVPEGLRITAQYALGRVSDDSLVVRTLIANMRRGESSRVRDKAACALAYDQIHLSEPQKVLLLRALIASLDDEKPDVRRIAFKALKIHTGQKKGYDPKAPQEQRQSAMEDWHRWLQQYADQL